MAGIKTTDLPAAASAALTDVFPVDQLPGPVTYKETNAQLLTLFKANGEALTKTDDTNVTLSLGGTPTIALLNATSLTLGWTGTLSPIRGGTGINNGTSTLTLAGSLVTVGAFASTFNMTGITNVTFPTSGTLATTAGTVSSVSGTANRITSTGGTTPVIDISASYVGQSSITTLGTITTGTWNATVLGSTYGGTGVNNGASTITLGGSLTTSGAFASTFTMTGITTVTFPTSGTLATTAALPTPAALTKADDTNVTLTLGGTPTTALLQATSITLGWTGTLAASRGGTGISSLGTGVATALGVNVNGSGAISLTTSPTFVTPTLGAATATSITFNPTTGGIVGTTTNDSASTGFVGEVLASAYTSGVAITSATGTMIQSLALTAGDWDVWATGTTQPAAGTLQTIFQACINVTSANVPNVSNINNYAKVTLALPFAATTIIEHQVGPFRVTVAGGGGNIYLNMLVTYSVSTLTAGGIIVARRRR